MPLSDLYVIMNPTAGRGRVLRAWPRVHEALRSRRASYELMRTSGRGHAAELAGAAAEAGWPAVLAVGGDGTVHEVANGLLKASGDGPTVPMGVVGSGTGNDFAKMLGVGFADPARAVERVLEAEARAVDVGHVHRWLARGSTAEDWYFTNGIGLGLDARVAVAASRVRRLRGIAVYGWALLQALRDLRTPALRVMVDGETVADEPLLLTTIANGACHGGSFWLCPHASVTDGLLDVLVAESLPLHQVLRLLPSVLRGEHLGHPAVSLHRGREVEVRSEEPLPIHADGEILAEGVRELSLTLLPGRLHVLA